MCIKMSSACFLSKLCSFILFYFLNEKFQLFTKMRDSKVYTSAYTFFSHSHCLFDLLVNVFND